MAKTSISIFGLQEIWMFMYPYIATDLNIIDRKGYSKPIQKDGIFRLDRVDFLFSLDTFQKVNIHSLTFPYSMALVRVKLLKNMLNTLNKLHGGEIKMCLIW